jgi:protein tyrosine phosphatase (PTP) superfamily phosphohydrolase (DUF442 family)
MPTHEIFNFIKIDARIATAGMPTKAQLEDARAEGYDAVVNLVPNGQDNALKGEDAFVRALGMAYHHIPVIWTAPQPADFQRFTDIMESLRGKKVLVHCAMNMRVTVFFSAYAMKNLGWTQAQADDLVKTIWTRDPRYPMDDTWRTFMKAIRP